jgi:hypothetical protein
MKVGMIGLLYHCPFYGGFIGVLPAPNGFLL